MKTLISLSLAALMASTAVPALAQSAGEFTVGLGLHSVSPKSDNGSLVNGTLDVDVGTSVRPTFTFEYFIRDNLGIEVLAALPFNHDIDIDGLGKVGSTKHLPPTVSLQYHFANDSRFTPFLGAGVNYTTFFDEDTDGALAGADLSLGDSFGLALHAGFDYALNDNQAIRADVRWMDIDTEVKLNGTDIGDVKIDPWVFGFAFVQKF